MKNYKVLPDGFSYRLISYTAASVIASLGQGQYTEAAFF